MSINAQQQDAPCGSSSQGGIMTDDDNADEPNYVGATLIYYDCLPGQPEQNCDLLNVLHLFDLEFETALKEDKKLSSVFIKIDTASQQGAVLDEDKLDGVEKMALRYIKHALISRARFACRQKIELSKHYADLVFDQDVMSRHADSELRYVYEMFEALELDDKMSDLKDLVTHCLAVPLDLIDVVVGSDTEDESIDDAEDNTDEEEEVPPEEQ